MCDCVVQVLMAAHIFACLWFYIGSQDDNGWVNREWPSNPVAEMPVAEQYLVTRCAWRSSAGRLGWRVCACMRC